MKIKSGHLVGKLSVLFAGLGLLMALSTQQLVAQGFEVTFGGNLEDQSTALVPTIDEGYLQIGFSESFGDDNDIDILAVKIDVDGQIAWSKIYDPGFDERATGAVALADGTFVIVGYRKVTFRDEDQVYLIKIDRRGNLIWDRTYPLGSNSDRGEAITATQDGGFLIVGNAIDPISDKSDVLLIRVDSDGQELWRETYGGSRRDEGIGSIEVPGGFIFGANIQGDQGPDNEIALYRINNQGGLVWVKVYGTETENEEIRDIIATRDGNFVFVGTTNNYNQALIAKANLNGDTLWYNQMDIADFDDQLFDLFEDNEGSLLAVGATSPSQSNVDILLVKIADNGQLQWSRRLGGDNRTDSGESIMATADGGYAIAGHSFAGSLVFTNDLFLIKVDAEGAYLNNSINGTVYESQDGCNPLRDTDRHLEGWLVKATSEKATYFASTDANGRYNMLVDTGSYTVSLLRKSDYWSLCNPLAVVVEFGESYDSTTYNFPVTVNARCPQLEVSISTPAITACSDAIYTVNYRNGGTEVAEAAYLTVRLDDELTYVTASIAPRLITDTLLTFDLGDIGPAESGRFKLTTAVSCDNIASGQAVGVTAHIYPDTLCVAADANWDGTSIEVTGRCENEEVFFTIRNTSNQAMTTTQNYVVIEEYVMRSIGSFNLGPQQVQHISLPATGATYRLIAEQSEGHPGENFPSIAIEGCATDDNYTTGAYTQFPENDGNPFIDIEVEEVIDTDVTLAMRGHPKGYQDSIIIPKTDLEYTIIFSNAGVDTLNRVVIRDTLPTALDFNSLEMGAASHPYEFEIYENGILRITLDNLQLPPGSSTDIDLRRGYVSYRLSQKPNTPVGTVIQNSAAVYFDNVAPTVTNPVRHVIGCADFFTTGCLLTDTDNPATPPGVSISVYPNPLGDRATLSIKGCEDCGPLTFTLYDMLGRPVRRENFSGTQWELYRNNLPPAMYFYELRSARGILNTGRLFVQ